jgi:3-oxoacyl-(acyl-carrier-protein) synthase
VRAGDPRFRYSAHDQFEKPPIPSATSITPRWSQKKKIRTAINNSFGFGGHNATLVLTEYTG